MNAAIADAIVEPHTTERIAMTSQPPWQFCPPKVTIADSPDTATKSHNQLIGGRNQRGWQAYTDGSRMDTGVGAAAIFYMNGEETAERSHTLLPTEGDVFDAELLAIHLAVTEVVHQLTRLPQGARSVQTTHVFSDSQAALLRIQATWSNDRRSGQSTAASIRTLLETIKRLGHNVEFHWIPSHTGIRGNERADAATRQAAEVAEADDVNRHRDTPLSVQYRCANDAAWVWARSDDQFGNGENMALRELTPSYDSTNFERYVKRGIDSARNLIRWRVASILNGYKMGRYTKCKCGHENPERDHFLLRCERTEPARQALFLKLRPECRTPEHILSGGDKTTSTLVDDLLRPATRCIPWVSRKEYRETLEQNPASREPQRHVRPNTVREATRLAINDAAVRRGTPRRRGRAQVQRFRNVSAHTHSQQHPSEDMDDPTPPTPSTSRPSNTGAQQTESLMSLTEVFALATARDQREQPEPEGLNSDSDKSDEKELDESALTYAAFINGLQ